MNLADESPPDGSAVVSAGGAPRSRETTKKQAAARALGRKLPLWLTLVTLMLVLVGGGVLVSDAIVTISFQRSVVNRIDQDITSVAQRIAERPLRAPIPPGKPLPQVGAGRAPTTPQPPESTSGASPAAPTPTEAGPEETLSKPEPDGPPEPYVSPVAPDSARSSRYYIRVGDRVFGRVRRSDGTPIAPKLPDDLWKIRTPQTVPSIGDPQLRWRVVWTPSLHGDVVVATELSDLDGNVASLVTLQLAIGSGVLLVLGLAAYFLVRWSLRPLVEVEHIAGQISAGDLERRVPDWGERTEVGRLSKAFNSMLSQIQHAFAATQASEEKAKGSEHRMRQFVADASHELRTPLTAIRGFAELHRKGVGVPITVAMSRIESEAIRMGRLVEDLLALARTDEQRPLAMEPVDLFLLVTDAVHDAKAIAPTRDVRFQFQAAAGAPVVLGDESALRQVLSNLVSNALRHTGEEAVVTLWLGGDDEHVDLEVRDTGAGLSAEDAERVFERFYRVDPSRARSSGGTGLGLAIVDAIVEAHHGQVSVRSELGVGTAFQVRLPRLAAGPEEDEDEYFAEE